MLKGLQSTVNAAASAASDGTVSDLRLETPPFGKGDIAICVGPLAKAIGGPAQTAGQLISDALASLPSIASMAIAGPFVNLRLDIDSLVRAASQAVLQPDIAVDNPQRI